MIRKVSCPDDIFNLIVKNKDRIDLISFDIFDTLVRRRFSPPDRSKIPAAKWISRQLRKRNIHKPIQEILKIRRKVENFIGASYIRQGQDWECPIEEVCVAWLHELFGDGIDPQFAKHIESIEFYSEKNFIRAEKGMLHLLKNLKSLNKRIVLISDMYLKTEQIEILLNNCGYEDLFDVCYVSSNYKLRKKTGRLYKLVLRDQKISPDRWIHVGDDKQSDVLQVKKMGGHAYWYMPKVWQIYNQRLQRLERLSQSRRAWKGAALLSTFTNPTYTEKQRTYTYSFGFEILGPILTNFIHQVIDKINNQNIDLVLFPAREGFVLRNIYLHLKPHLGIKEHVKDKYCFLNRKTVFPASIYNIGAREIYKTFTYTQFPSIKTMLIRLGAEPEQFVNIAKSCQIDSIESVIRNPYKNANFLKFINHPDFLKLIAKVQKRHYKIVEKYLKQLGFWDSRKVAFVDIGWQGTVQDALTLSFENNKNWPQFYGYYLGFLGKLPYKQSPLSTYEGILYDHKKQSTNYSVFERFLQLFEIATRAPHGTATDLIEDSENGEIIPKLTTSEQAGRSLELKDKNLISGLQEGIFDFVDEYAQLLPIVDLPPTEISPYLVSSLYRILRFPSFKTSFLFDNFCNIEDFGSEFSRDHSEKKFSFGSILQWRRIFNKEILWKEGFLVSRKIPGLLSLYNFASVLNKRNF